MTNSGHESVFDFPPSKLWECDCCFSVSREININRNGGSCPACGHDTFSEVELIIKEENG